ncbi:MAG: sensor histidine kinase, partial [Candidatus Helarchaeales archaeon]
QLTPKIKEKELKIEMEFQGNPFINGDPQKIIQIFRIILDNAIKFLPTNGHIIIKTRNHQILQQKKRIRQEGIQIDFIDDGPGIPKDDIPYIFDRFFRSRLTSHIPGTGLGLAIARELVQLHHGTISVQSEEGKGTCFSIFFPRNENFNMPYPT